MAIRPTCFCKPAVVDCPKCSKADYDKMRPSSGRAESSAKVLKARLMLRTVAA